MVDITQKLDAESARNWKRLRSIGPHQRVRFIIRYRPEEKDSVLEFIEEHDGLVEGEFEILPALLVDIEIINLEKVLQHEGVELAEADQPYHIGLP
jgi:hypothetical protein